MKQKLPPSASFTLKLRKSSYSPAYHALIRQAVETVKVLSDHEILVCLRGGIEIRQEVI